MSPRGLDPALNQRVAISPRVFLQPVGYQSTVLDEGENKIFQKVDGARHVPISMEMPISHVNSIEIGYSCLATHASSILLTLLAMWEWPRLPRSLGLFVCMRSEVIIMSYGGDKIIMKWLEWLEEKFDFHEMKCVLSC